jgi:hypothetical protein
VPSTRRQTTDGLGERVVLDAHNVVHRASVLSATSARDPSSGRTPALESLITLIGVIAKECFSSNHAC